MENQQRTQQDQRINDLYETIGALKARINHLREMVYALASPVRTIYTEELPKKREKFNINESYGEDGEITIVIETKK